MQLRKSRLGLFLVLIGLILLAVFFTTDQSLSFRPDFFLGGLVAIGLGYWLIRREQKPPAPSQRFSLLRKMRQKPAGAEEKKQLPKK